VLSLNTKDLEDAGKYLCDRNSSAEVLKEVLKETIENKKLINNNSKTNIGDKLYAKDCFFL
jgi:hypothetical protein